VHNKADAASFKKIDDPVSSGTQVQVHVRVYPGDIDSIVRRVLSLPAWKAGKMTMSCVLKIAVEDRWRLFTK